MSIQKDKLLTLRLAIFDYETKAEQLYYWQAVQYERTDSMLIGAICAREGYRRKEDQAKSRNGEKTKPETGNSYISHD